MIVTIDGPAGAGKSTLARRLAERLGYRFLDTGAMYRAVALAAIRRGVDWSDGNAIVRLADEATIEMPGDRVLLNGEDVSDAIRAAQVTSVIHHVADHPLVRRRLSQLQREVAAGGDIVTEGRDQGAEVFPDAECKIFLTASVEERTRRRVQDFQRRGEEAAAERVRADILDRDRRDESRAVGRLQKAPDALEVVTDGLSPEQVLDRLTEIVLQIQARSAGE